MANKYFGTDGFRGLAGVTITAEHAFKVGRVIGWYFGAANGKKCRVVIGKDTRLSSYMLEYALAAGLTSSGADAYILHVTTTPSVSYVTRCDGFDCGVMISASHNPYQDNGIKLMNSRGEKMEVPVISLIEGYLSGDFPSGDIPFARGEKIGRTVDYVAGRNRYIGHLISLSTCSYKGLKVGLDTANGSSFMIAKSVFDALGANVYTIGANPNGLNVNRGVGSTNISALQSLVLNKSLDMGFAFDGDADRCIAVDERGNIIDGDGELYVLAKHLKLRGELTGNKIVTTVMSNGGLKKSLALYGVECEECAVGDRFVCEKMNETGAILGGEKSGHVVFSKFETTGDGLVTALQLMEVAVAEKCAFSELMKGFTSFPQKELSIRVKAKREIAEKLKDIPQKIALKYGVRLIVRPSGTEEVIRVMAEGENEESICAACAEVENAIKRLSE